MILLHHVPVCSSVSDMAVQASVASFKLSTFVREPVGVAIGGVVAFFLLVCSVNT